MASEAAKGKAAFDKSDYPTAITHLTAALKESKSPKWLIERSTAYQRLQKHDLALEDADAAVVAAHGRGVRELIATAQFRRAVALNGLGRFGDARMCLHWCSKFNEKEKGLTLWLAKVKSDYEKGDEKSKEVTVKEIPDASVPAPKKTVTAKAVEKKEDDSTKSEEKKPFVPLPTSIDKIRHQWIQSPSSVTVDILAKGIPKDADVKIQEGSLEVSFPVAGSNSTYDFSAEPLFAKVDTAKSSFRVTPHKIEIILHKAIPGLKWSNLEGTEPITSAPAEETPKIPDVVLKETVGVSKAPAYPTSSKTGPKNWDTLLDNEKEDEDAGVDDFFKKLYKDASPDVRRAMMKSYQESNGTSLSTNWDEVGKKPVETHPPEGMEAKPWGT